MGILLRLMKYSNEDKEEIPEVYIDFENVVPSELEAQIYSEISFVSTKFPEILNLINSYSGASELIRKTIANPKDIAIQEETWEVLKPLLSNLNSFYDFSLDLARIIVILMKELVPVNNNVIEVIKSKPALVQLLCQLLNFCICFDEKKMSLPSIQNDLSFYRRTLSHKNASKTDEELIIPREKANKISLFLAGSTPFMTTLVQTITKTFNTNQSPNLTEINKTFSIIVKLSRLLLDHPEFITKIKENDTKHLIMRVMVGFIILYDHIDVHGGVFCKSSLIDVKSCIKIITSSNEFNGSSLISSIKFSSKNYTSDTTPSALKEMLEKIS